MTQNNKLHNIQTAEEQTPEKIEESFDLTGLLLDYVANWKFFALSFIVCLGIAYCYIRTVVPTYQVGAAVYLNDDNTTKTSAVSMSSESPMFDMKKMIDETELEILKSRNSLLKIVDTLQLSYSYYTIGKWRNIPVYKTNPIIARMDSTYLNDLQMPLILDVNKKDNGIKIHIEYGKDYSASAEAGHLPATVTTPAGEVVLMPNDDYFADFSGTLRIVIERPNLVAARLSSGLSVHYAPNASTIVNFEYTTSLPEQGSDILKMIILFYNRQIIEDKNRAAIQTEQFIQARLKDIQNELKGVEEHLKDYRERHQIVNVDAQVSMNLTQSRSTENSIIEIQTQERLVNDLLSEVNSLSISDAMTQLSHINGFSDSQAVNTAIQEYNREVDNYNAQRPAMTEENEIIQGMINRLREQKKQISNRLSSVRNQLSEQRRNIAQLESRSNSQLAAQPQVDKGLQEIFRDQSVKANIYTFLLQKREEIALQKTLATPTAQFIDNPLVLKQVAPIPSRIYLYGMIIGLLIPALLIFAKRKFLPRFKDKADIARITKVPIIGEISQANTKHGEVVVGENVSTSEAELFRLLRNNINFARTGGEKKVIMLTSAISGEGKTFVSLNLAMTYALTGKRVVVIGLDIRRPVLAHKLGLSNRFGVTSFLSEQVDRIDDIIFPTEYNPNLFAIPAGPIPPNPNELLLSPKMDEFFELLKERFDHIIVDTAPFALVSDSLLLVPHTDMQIFVTRASYSTRRGIHIFHEAINNGQIPKGYIVINGVNMNSRIYKYRHYGSYYSSSYGYKNKSSKSKKKDDAK